MSATMPDRIAEIQVNIRAACLRAGRSPTEVTLIAVSKTQPVANVLAAVTNGLTHFGENYMEEAKLKIPLVNAAAERPLVWHMIGHVQRRKARDVPPLFQLVHSLDSVALATRYGQVMQVRSTGYATNLPPIPVLLEINVSGEASKDGFNGYRWEQDRSVRNALWEAIRQVQSIRELAIQGLMTMAPIVEEMEQTRPIFASLRRLRDALTEDFPSSTWSSLSMGMTDDYPIAVEEGATMLRIGRAIFGERA